MTQDQLAWSAGTSQRNIVRWERGHTQPRAGGVVARLAEATGHPVEFFYTETAGPVAEDEKVVADLMAALRVFVQSEQAKERTAA